MDVSKCPEYHLHQLTLHLLGVKEQLIPENCDVRCVDATIINRAYYSSYLFCELWLWIVHDFKVTHPWQFAKGQKRQGEHKQVRTALKYYGADEIEEELSNLAKLRNLADYKPYKEITQTGLNEAINHMELIFNHLKFD